MSELEDVSETGPAQDSNVDEQQEMVLEQPVEPVEPVKVEEADKPDNEVTNPQDNQSQSDVKSALHFGKKNIPDAIYTSWARDKPTSLDDDMKAALWEFNFELNNQGRCFCCQQPLRGEDWKRGYVVPRSLFGCKNTSNIKPICIGCHKHIGVVGLYDYMIQNQLAGMVNLGEDPVLNILRQVYDARENYIELVQKLVDDHHLSPIDGRIHIAQLKSCGRGVDRRLALMRNIQQFYDRCYTE